MTPDTASAIVDQHVDDLAVRERRVACAHGDYREVIVGTHQHAYAALIAHDAARHSERAAVRS